MHASMTYNDKQDWKVLGDLSLITINFWTVCRSILQSEVLNLTVYVPMYNVSWAKFHAHLDLESKHLIIHGFIDHDDIYGCSLDTVEL